MNGLDKVTAVILAGGLGTRLRPVVSDRPKALADVGGRPFLSYLLDQLAGAGVRRVVLCTGYRGEMVRAAYGDVYRGLRLVHSRESSPLGTGGALGLAVPLLRSNMVLVLNGDSFCGASLQRFWVRHRGSGGAGALVLTRVPDTSRYGRVVCRGGRVDRFEEKDGQGGPGWVNAGVYLLSRRVVAAIPAGRAVSLEKEVLPGLIAEGLYGYRSRGRFVDIGTPDTFVAAPHILSMDGGDMPP